MELANTIIHLAKRRGGGGGHGGGGKPASPKETLIIAICLGVTIGLIFLLVLWYYRCFCCCARRRGDYRDWKEIIRDGFAGWQQGGRRPKKRPASGDFEKLNGDDTNEHGDSDVEAGKPPRRNSEDRFENKPGQIPSLALPVGVLSVLNGVASVASVAN